MTHLHYQIAGEQHLVFTINDQIQDDNPAQLLALQASIEEIFGDSLQETVIAYCSILIQYDLNQVLLPQALELAEKIIKSHQKHPLPPSVKHHKIPVCYHQSLGLDLEAVSHRKKLSIDEIIQIHTAKIYQVYAVGFSPAFAYLGSVDPRIANPRHKSPRKQIPAGSVGIADQQTAIYPVTTPAGWQILGQTPIDLSLNDPANLSRFQIGDQIEFYPINLAEFERWSKQ